MLNNLSRRAVLARSGAEPRPFRRAGGAGRLCACGRQLGRPLAGWWAMQGVALHTPLQPEAADLSRTPSGSATGTVLALKAWHCKACGAVQLFDVKP